MIKTTRTDTEVCFLENYVFHRRDDFAVQEMNGRYRRAGRNLNEEDVENHVLGFQTIGSYQSRYPDETCSWIVYDIDDHGDGLAEIQRNLLTESFDEQGIPFYTEHSGSRDSLHLWMFLNRPTPLGTVYNFSRALILRNGCYLFSDEVFPKQSKLSQEKNYGNLVKAPFGINRKNGIRSFFEKPIDSIETIDLSSWRIVKLPVTKVGARKPIDVYQGQKVVGRVAGCVGVRPCIKEIINSGIQLRHDAGHKLRIAVASELLNAGWSETDVANIFSTQMDFDPDVCEYQVRSLRGYNRPACDTIRQNCKKLKVETGFNVDSVCENCIHRQDEHHDWGKLTFR